MDSSLALPISVDHGGKLFERIETGPPVTTPKDPFSDKPGQLICQRVFAHATEIGRARAASQWAKNPSSEFHPFSSAPR